MSTALVKLIITASRVYKLAIEVMSVEVTGQLYLVINQKGRGLCGFVHVQCN